MKSLLISIFLLATTAAFAQDPDKTVTLKASGSGTTQEQAKNNALRSAVEQAYGAFISSKTEVLNDQVVADEIVSVASGNIQAFKILEEQHTDSLNFCLLEAVVSISKLTSFAQSKGYAVEVQGGMFAINIKQKQLNESAEVVAIRNGLTTALDILDNGFDFKIKTSEPVVNDAIKGDWKMVVDVETYTNENYVSAHKIVHSLLNSIGMNDQEVAEYKALGKTVYQLNYHFPDQTIKSYCLRTSDGLWAFIRFANKIPNLTQRFKIEDGVKDYKNGVELDYENISNITFQENIQSMISQYNSIENNRKYSPWQNTELMQKLYDVENKINPLTVTNDIYGYYPLRNFLFRYECYYEFYPIVCVEALEYYEILKTKISNTKITFTYTLNEIEKITEIKANPLDNNKTPLNRGFWSLVDITVSGRPQINNKVAVPVEESRPFIFSEPINNLTPDVKNYLSIKSDITDDKYNYNFIRRLGGYNLELINGEVVTSFLEKESIHLNTSNLRKGIYKLKLVYVSETDGTVVFYGILNAVLFHKKDPSSFLSAINHDIEIDEKCTNEEIILLKNWINEKTKEINNHPIGISGKYCNKKMQCRTPITSDYYLYVN